MKFVDFFAGIGGFRRGMELAGHECVGFCEWDKFAVASYTSMHLITDKQREYLATLPMKKRQKEILKEEYRNGEWYASDIMGVDAASLPAADCWCFGAPCQDFSVAGKRAGLRGGRSSLISEIFRLLGELEEKDRPEWLIYENVKGMLSSNRGLDFLTILSEMDRLGYDIEWQNLHSEWYVPQHRERIYTCGHLRERGRRKILPIQRTDGENSVQQIGNHLPAKTRQNPNQRRIYETDGISPCLNSIKGGGREPSVGIKVIGTVKPQMHSLEDIHDEDGIMSCLTSRDYKSPKKVGIKIKDDFLLNGNNYNQRKVVHGNYSISRTIIGSGHSGNEIKVAIPVSTPEISNKNQNGRRFKEDGDPMFALTARDRHGVAIKVREATKKGYAETEIGDSVNLSMPESKTRRGRVGKGVAQTLDTSCNQGVVIDVTPEVLGGIYTHDAGVVMGLLRTVRSDFGKSIRKKYEAGELKISRHKFLEYEIRKDGIANTLSTVQKDNLLDIGFPKEQKENGIYIEMPQGFTVYVVWHEKYQCYITIRKLIPKECFRLQGWTDDYFERAAFVNSNSQLYKQAGNGVTVSVVRAIGERIAEQTKGERR